MQSGQRVSIRVPGRIAVQCFLGIQWLGCTHCLTRLHTPAHRPGGTAYRKLAEPTFRRRSGPDG